MIISIIVAVAENNVIGYKNQLIWHLPADLKRFKQITSGHYIIMGRKTYESVGKPLPNRTNIIITSNKNYKAEGCYIVHSLEEAINFANGQKEVFILGGGTVYKQAIDIADKLYITRIHKDFVGDTFFIEIDRDKWQLDMEEIHQPDEKNKLAYSFRNYIRKTENKA
ncbi:MAG: dihydrofolate reductase [Chlorobi bacterium]|nr:dihydrofolate reductase [Chlorobiota bacterium]